jgi:hypothetical protein
MSMEMVNDRNESVLSVKRLTPLLPRELQAAEAFVAPGPKPAGDIVLLVALAFEILQIHLRPLSGGG